MRKIRIAQWEILYVCACMIMFGFWMGYILGGSSSWLAQKEYRDEIIPNLAVIISMSFVLFVAIKGCIHFYRLLEISKKKRELIQGK